MKINGSKNDRALFASKIIKAGALLPDTRILLGHWNVELSTKENLDQISQGNYFGKASRSRVSDILAIFKQRYLGDNHVTKALVCLVHEHVPAQTLDRILYFHSARADSLIRQVVLDVLIPLHRQGIFSIEHSDVERQIDRWVSQGLTTSPWGEYTIHRVAQGILATLRDFGVLNGVVNKRIAPAYLPTEAFAYICFFLKLEQPSGIKLIELPDWQLFFLSPTAVERFLLEAHQEGILDYHAAGAVTRLSFPVKTLEEYAHVLARRTH
ncbi:DUF1819 family protein [bacterium]|nr:DUF1819 family protein [bacterium]